MIPHAQTKAGTQRSGMLRPSPGKSDRIASRSSGHQSQGEAERRANERSDINPSSTICCTMCARRMQWPA